MNHTNRLNGFLPARGAAGIETVESMLVFPIDCKDRFLSKFIGELESLLLEKKEALFHLKDPIPCVKGKESLLLDSLVGVPTNLSLGLLLARAFALADAVGAM